MTNIAHTECNNAAASRWDGKVAHLGYRAAYGQFVRASLRPLNRKSRVCDIGTGCGTSASFSAIGKIPLPMMTAPPVGRRFTAELIENVA